MGQSSGSDDEIWQQITQQATDLQVRADKMRADGDLSGAIDCYGEAIEMGPPNTALYFLRGTARMEVGDHAGASQDFETGLRLDPKNETLRNLLPRVRDV